MNAVSHQFPGRIRLRFPQLKGAPLATAQVAASLRRLAGVLGVEPSPVTGSLLVTYSVRETDELRLWNAVQDILARHGLPCRDGKSAPQAGGGKALPAGGGIADKVAGAIVDKLLEKAALTVVAALL